MLECAAVEFIPILNIEGKNIPWDKPVITTEEIATLGGWDSSQGVIMVDKENHEKTLTAGETIKLKPGLGFGKRVRWKRGFTSEQRIAEELAVLKLHYGEGVQYNPDGDWFLIKDYPLPANCDQKKGSVCFNLKPGYPAVEPYGFFVASAVTCSGASFAITSAVAAPPFPGQWVFISWSPEGWVGTVDVLTGCNLWGWARSFFARLAEGVN